MMMRTPNYLSYYFRADGEHKFAVFAFVNLDTKTADYSASIRAVTAGVDRTAPHENQQCIDAKLCIHPKFASDTFD